MGGIINRTNTIDVGLVVTAGAYSDGDVVGGRINLNDLCGGGGGGVIRQVLIADDAAQSAVFKLYLYDGQPTSIADNAAFASAMTMEDLEKLVAVIDIAAGDIVTLNSNTYALKTGLDYAHGSGQLWAYLVLNGSTPTYAAIDDLTLKITGWKD